MNMVKVVIVGDGCVGKTSILHSYTMDISSVEYVPTVFDNYACNVYYENKIYKLQLCDTAGQEEYQSLRVLNYPKTDVFILCFSLVEPVSFQNIRNKWILELDKYYQRSIPKILVGNKVDLRDDREILRKVTPITTTQGYNLSREIGAFQYVECSSLKMINVDLVFERVMDAYLYIPITKKNEKKCIVL